jgi:EAL domain-containing protein (putative c-di-GMP-specific phosphodiesterase class I)/FixJ family two-component response regulator
MADAEQLRLLLVDDDPAVLRAYASGLARHGVIVETAGDGREAVERVEHGAYDVVVSDIAMPGMNGIAFLAAVRLHDLDVPVILMTGAPSLESAVRAVEYGAFRYLMKPVDGAELWTTVQRAGALHKLAKLRRDIPPASTSQELKLQEHAALDARFAAALDHAWIAWQPIVQWKARGIFGYEALVRSDEPLMNSPEAILDAADRLGRLRDLGRVIRAKIAGLAQTAGAASAKLFVNLHPSDLNDEELYSQEAPLSRFASHVVLEVTERSSLFGVANVATSVAKLKGLGFQIAIDDLGAGYSGLMSFTELDPEVAKLDMSLIRDIDVDPRRQSIVRSMKQLCDELGILVVAEGVETVAERDMLVHLGCDLLQGYLFARPAREFQAPRW